MVYRGSRCVLWAVVLTFAAGGWLAAALAAEPEALNPFGKMPNDRDDSIPGYVELSDGSIHCGMIYLTRDKRLQIDDEKIHRQRQIPLNVVKQLECKVKKEWMEKEWKFKELAKDEKMFTGRSYPAREYEYVVTLQDGRTIEGGLSGIVYCQPATYNPKAPNAYRPQVDPDKYLLHKRDKGEIGDELKSLVYVKLLKLGDDAYKEGREKAAKKGHVESKPAKRAAD